MYNILKGGIHPKDNKSYVRAQKIEVLPLPAKLYIPLRQHIGEPCVPVVKPGDLVKKGQVIADSANSRIPPIHSSTSGKVTDIGNYPDPAVGVSQCIVIESDGRDEWLENIPMQRDFEKMSVDELLKIIHKNGIVGMGGAAFPAHIKLSPPKGKKIDTLIINGAECEPYLTSDYRIMIEFPKKLIKGCKILMKILNVNFCYIGIEDNKRKAIKFLRRQCVNTSIKIVSLHTRYPQGAEKMIIKGITGREVPSGKLPLDIGCVVQNVGTVVAITDAVEKNIPLIERVITVSGETVISPKNIMAKIGATFRDAFNYCEGFKETPAKLIMGGPMMGIAVANIDSAIIKATSGILALTAKELDPGEERACIKCGRCLEACMMRLRPNMLSILSERRKHQTALVEYDLMDCVECGCCSYVCPAKRNIVHYIKLSKAKNAALKTLKK
jgi:Na+-translocating ferredoxin:NAD+ oxidoreductase subunit C